MSEEENVKVAVRVRPFNKREKGRKAKNIIQMNGKVTKLLNPDDEADVKAFTYDFSYWSFDGSKEMPDGYFAKDSAGSKYCDQKTVFDDLGGGILKNAWDGYNSTLFAYGQTGSGKSWSVIGYGANKGVVPMFCEKLFQGITEQKGTKEFEVRFSMLEIYNEVVRDLLNPSKKKQGLKVRQHPKKGFYAEGLKMAMVSNYQEIEQKMNEGTVNRTIASTNMNATSSRAHTIVGIEFTQKFKNGAGQETAKKAVVNLVDLAGSERVDSTGATGERLKEGAGINLSLTCLGNCIHALAENASGKPTRVPFRDSKLTKLLMNALGGNSKTIMIAAISPADINYEETLSTLRYADRAKQIKTKATVNEDPTEKLLRELKEENEKLKKMMTGGKIDMDLIDEDGDGVDDRDAEKLKKKWEEEMKARMMENEKEMMDMKKTYEEKLKQSKMEHVDPSIAKKEEEKQKKPHIYNLNVDPLLTGRVVHILRPGANTVGNRKGEESNVTIIGPSIQEQHAVMTVNKEGKVSIKPQNTECRVVVNGSPIQGETTLCHNDRLVFGGTQFWLFQNPTDRDKNKMNYPEITFEYAQEEIASKSGIDMASSNADMSKVQQDLMEVMLAVEEANSISEELDRMVKFEIMLVSPQVLGQQGGKTEGSGGVGKPKIQVKMRNLQNGTEFVWPKEKFLNRLYLMKEMYTNYEDDDEWEKPEEEDPFQESLDTEIRIGTAQVILQPLAHSIELNEQLEITNYKGAEVGIMNVEIVPCDATGKDYAEEDDKFVDIADDLIGTDVFFNVRILNCRGLPNRYADVYCTYSVYLDEEPTKTKKISDTSNPDFNHAKQYSFTPATRQLVEYLNNGSLVINVMGKQRVRKSAMPRTNGLTTKDMLRSDRAVFAKTANLMNGFQMNGRVVDPQKQSIIVELLLMKKTQARLQQKVDSIRKLVKEAENISKVRVSTSLLKEVLQASTPEQADLIIRKITGN
ncbi:kinesin-like protein KIF28P isoform X3 [Penaeus chinensis]|uniref:kinesin-like protein KIF28P isoform X3 n=1 Tax=Penaeus chinensis TaxID=139456 RepID=UPI001FB6167D|nr:kinesin-like protein KIF28P isoform X3 [Penaeus chinensis]